MTQRHRATCQFATAGETMQDGGKGALPHFLFQNARGIVVRLTRMDDKRQPSFARSRDVSAKSAFLRFARRIVVVVVKAGFADRHDFRGAAAAYELVRSYIQFFMCVMRMRSDRAINVWKALGQRKQCGLPADACGDRDHALDTGSAGSRQHGIELVRKIGEIKVAVAVDQHLRSIVPLLLTARHNAEKPQSAREASPQRQFGAVSREKQSGARAPEWREDQAISRPKPA